MLQFILVVLAFVPSLDQLTTKLGGYFIGLAFRIASHLGTPALWFTLRRQSLKNLMEPFKLPNKELTFKFALAGSLGAIFSITGLFLLLRQFMDFSNIQAQISTIYELTIPTYILVGLTISIINPLIEEYFWRAFIFAEYHKRGGGYWTGILFALHHAVIMYAWFELWVLSIAILGLAFVGVLFNWAYARTGSVWAGLITHVAADITIIVIGYFVLF